MNLLTKYLKDNPTPDIGTVAFLANLENVREASPIIADAIVSELKDQRTHLKLIASENFCSLAVQSAMGNLLTDKYAEGYPNNRFYAGCQNVDTIEAEAARLACELFGAEHAYVQPHSGADANLVAFLAILMHKIGKPFSEAREEYQNQKMMALDLSSGGHLTHGYKLNASSLMFDIYSYSVEEDTHLLDLDKIRKQALEVKPLILLAGYSAYPRHIDFSKLREIADEVGAVLMVDMAHFSGLVAGGAFSGVHNPVPYAHVVTSTTHKTLRGPRGGMVLCKKEFAEFVDKGCPSVLGGPLPHIMAAKAIAFKEALSPDFKAYAKNIIVNSGALARALVEKGVSIITGGTDNHLILMDVSTTYGLTGRQAESALRAGGVTLNRNAVPFDTNGPWYTSGLRLGTPALTTLGMGVGEMEEVAGIIHSILSKTSPVGTSLAKYDVGEEVLVSTKARVEGLLARFPLYSGIPYEL